jgi:hypothetical protein
LVARIGRPGVRDVAGRELGVRLESGREPFVSVMKATNLRNGHDRAVAGRGDRARNRRIFVERQVGP